MNRGNCSTSERGRSRYVSTFERGPFAARDAREPRLRLIHLISRPINRPKDAPEFVRVRRSDSLRPRGFSRRYSRGLVARNNWKAARKLAEGVTGGSATFLLRTIRDR